MLRASSTRVDLESSIDESEDAFPCLAKFEHTPSHGTSSSNLPRGCSALQRRTSMNVVDHVAEVLHNTMMLQTGAKVPRCPAANGTVLRRVGSSPRERRPDAPRRSSVGEQSVDSPGDLSEERGRKHAQYLSGIPDKRPSASRTMDSILLSATTLPTASPALQQPPSPPPPPPPPPVVVGAPGRSVVRQRALKQQQWQREAHLAEMQQQQLRTEAAAMRKQFVEQQHKIQRACSWWAIAALCRMHESFSTALLAHRTMKKTTDLLIPQVLIGLRRALRRARQRLYAEQFVKPTIAGMRMDKVFALYSDAHLAWTVAHMQLRHYFQNETIIFVGLEEQEAFVLASGTADVMLGQTRVFTLHPGMTFGTVGMLTGEPRSATIVARAPLFAWVVARSDFDAFGSGGDAQVLAAMTTINELRERNLRTVYQTLLDPASLVAKFPTFANLAVEAAALLLTKGVAKVIRKGEMLVAPSKPGHGFILRGRARLWLPTASLGIPLGQNAAVPSAQSFFASPAELAEAMTLLIQSMAPRNSDSALGSSDADDALHAITDAANACFRNVRSLHEDAEGRASSNSHRRLGGALYTMVAEFDGPLLLNIPAAVGVGTRMTASFYVDVPNGCDGVMWQPALLNRSDVVASIRQNALNLRIPFFPTLTTVEAVKTLFPGSLSFDFLSKMCRRNHQPPGQGFTKWVFPPNHTLTFSTAANDVLLVLRGSIATEVTAGGGASVVQSTMVEHESNHHAPFVWPGIHLAFFGSVAVNAKTVCRTDVVRLPRADLIAWMLRDVHEAHLTTLIFALTAWFIDRTGRRPCWTAEGLQLQHLPFPASKLRAMKAMATAAVAPHALLPLHEGTRLAHEVPSLWPDEWTTGDQRRNNEQNQSEDGTDDNRMPQKRCCGDSAAIQQERLRHAQQTARNKKAMAQWKGAMSSERPPFWRRKQRTVSSSDSVEPRRRTISLPDAETAKKERHPLESSSSSSEGSSVERGPRHDTTPTKTRVNTLHLSVRDAAHQRQTHGVPSTYWQWQRDHCHGVPTAGPSAEDRHPKHAGPLVTVRPPTAGTPSSSRIRLVVPLTNQASHIAQAIEQLPRPTTARMSSTHNSARLVAMSSSDRADIKRQLLRELQAANIGRHKQ